MTTEDELEEKLRGAGIPAIHLVATDNKESKSKIGGLPDVPDNFKWPQWKGKPLSFIAQIDLSKLQKIPSLSSLPDEGFLYFFYDQNQDTWGFDPEDRGSWQVQYHKNTQSLQRANKPQNLQNESLFVEQFVKSNLVSSFPSLQRIHFPSELPDEAFDIEQDLKSEQYNDSPEHQIGGFPNPVQGDDMELEAQLVSNGFYCGDAKAYHDPKTESLRKEPNMWQLLLQIDSDEAANMMWGDSGRLYFWIHKSDLEKTDFSNVWMVLQCS